MKSSRSQAYTVVPLCRIALLVLLALLFGTSAYSQVKEQPGLRETANTLVQRIVQDEDAAKLKGQRLFIAEFANINGRGDAVPKIFQEMLTTSFIIAKHFRVVERAQLEKALRELKISTTGLLDLDQAKQVGKMLGATYMVVGSIAEDTPGQVSFDARLVDIETGESITAAFAAITQPGVATAPAQPTTMPAVNLNQATRPTGTGELRGTPKDFGLMGGTNFKVAWREQLGNQNIVSFCAGDLRRDGQQRLVTLTEIPDFFDKYQPACQLRVLSWGSRGFRTVWEGEKCYGDGQFVRAVSAGNAGTVIYRTNRDGSECWQWDGKATYRMIKKLDWRPVYDVQHYNPTCLIGKNAGSAFVLEYSAQTTPETMFAWLDKQGDPECKYFTVYIGNDRIFTAADFFGDREQTIASVSQSTSNNGECIELFGQDRHRKAITENTYGNRLTVWKPVTAKLPFLVACKNEVQKDGDNTRPAGGYVYLLQWDGEVLGEFWKSDKLDEFVLDMQVCDPKGEGADGLVVLSGDNKGNRYLTKITCE